MKFIIFLASLNNKILQKVSLIVKIMIKIKKEKSCEISVKRGTRQKLTRTVNM